MRDIRAGEELTHDWAMTDDDDYSADCKCGASNCRKTLTGKDWKRADLQKRYAGYFSAYITRKIAIHCHSDPATCDRVEAISEQEHLQVAGEEPRNRPSDHNTQLV
jgi:hypothetical protein